MGTQLLFFRISRVYGSQSHPELVSGSLYQWLEIPISQLADRNDLVEDN